ncbi:hypothetical protein EVAR_69065_1 [Eumeta japonica]|uniref:Nucleic-acid-binding protein from transposon X-element n=1 Tax=Eumeta variegata TaxID=151549 RepID=A0A4C1ZJ27_EUMVA|nr:hypothetical protein EVAR_69065_1 [Eumeta japonica]
MLPAAFDEDVKAYGLTAVPFLCFFGGFLVCESRTHLCARAHGRPIMGFFSSFPIPLARGKLRKKKIMRDSCVALRCELGDPVAAVRAPRVAREPPPSAPSPRHRRLARPPPPACRAARSASTSPPGTCPPLVIVLVSQWLVCPGGSSLQGCLAVSVAASMGRVGAVVRCVTLLTKVAVFGLDLPTMEDWPPSPSVAGGVPKTKVTHALIKEIVSKALNEMSYECPDKDLNKFVRSVTPSSSRTTSSTSTPVTSQASSSNLSRSHSPTKGNKRRASSSSDNESACSDSTIVGSDSESESGKSVKSSKADKAETSFTLVADCTRLRINYTKAVRTADDGIKIICSNVKTFRSLNKYLVDNRVQFHTYALEEERKIKAVIRGIPTDFPIEEIKSDLCGQGFPVHSESSIGHVTQRRHSHVPSGHAHSASDLRYARTSVRIYRKDRRWFSRSWAAIVGRRTPRRTALRASPKEKCFLNGEIQRRGPNRPPPCAVHNRPQSRAACRLRRGETVA